MLLTPAGAALSVSAREADDGGATPDMSAPTDGLANVTLDGARLTVTGPTNRTVTSSAPVGGQFSLSVSGLAPGAYSVTVEGLVNGQVAHFGQTSNVSVVAGRDTPATVSFPVFQPVIPNASVVDTTDVLHFTVSYGTVSGATGYLVEWSTDPTMASGVSNKTVTGLSTDVVVTQEGKYYVRVKAINSSVTAGGLPSPTKAVYVFQGVATVTVTPATPTIAAGATQQLTPEARDADNLVVPGITWFWASSNQSVATVNQSGLVTGVGGGQATITAMAKGTPGNATLSVTGYPATKLAFTLQPGNASAGQTIPTVQVAVQNLNGQTVTTDNSTQVTVAIGTDAGPGGALTGLATVSAVAGIANFTNLAIAKAGAGYTLTAAATGLTGATSGNFNIAPGAATQLAFTVQPTAAPASVALSPAVQVTVQDALGNRVTSASNAVTVAIGNNPGSGTLIGTKVVNAVSGVASFSGLSIDKGGTGYTLTAATSGLTGATSNGFDIGAASQLAFSIPPASAVAGDPLSPAVQVEIRNASGQLITTARDAVTIAFANNAGGGTLSGTKTVNAINGIASFTGVWINKSATGYTLSASSGTLTAATSPAFNITPGAAAKLDFNPQPGNAQGNVAFSGGVTVRILDAFDNFVNTATTSVTLALGNNPFKGFFGVGGTLSATQLTVSAVAGAATFGNVRVDKPSSGYTLVASAASTNSTTSDGFNVNVGFTGALSAGNSHTCAISAASGTYCWGSNYNGELGAPTGSEAQDSVPSLVRGGLTFTSVSTGSTFSCALTTAGAAYCWGYGGNGQLGNGGNTDSAVPVAVSGSHTFASIDAGSNHICGVTTASGTAAEDRQVYCWGYNGNYQLGNGSSTASNVPVRVAEPLQTTLRATSVSAGNNHACAVANNGAAYCWGYNGNGQLGDATNTLRPVPTLVSGGFLWSSISAGGNHTCGVTTTNLARCWGYNYYGALGDGTNTNTTAPVLVAGAFTNWSRISAGQYHSCGTLSNGLSFCWGYNSDGELGDGNTANTNAPSLVAGNLTFLAIDVGAYHSCGRTASALYCWGYNGNGRLGSLGVNQIKRSPTQIVQ